MTDYGIFMEKYGNKVLQKYNLPASEEIEAMKINGIDPDTGLNLEEEEEEEDD